MTFLADIQNSANWDNLWAQTFTAQAAPYPLGGHYPIPDFELPIQIDNRLIAARANSQSAKPRYWLGYRLVQIIPVAGAADGIRSNRFRVPLHQWSLIHFPLISTNYVLKIEFPPWLADVTVLIMGFTGPVTSLFDHETASTNTIMNELQNIKAML